MGNRAVIVQVENDDYLKYETNEDIEKFLENHAGIYLHWNGGRDSIEGFLEYARLCGIRSSTNDLSYSNAQLIRIIANFFEGTLSIGVDNVKSLDTDNYDNGVYIVKDFNIVRRLYPCDEEQQNYSLGVMLDTINNNQPHKLQEIYANSDFKAELQPV